MSAKTFFNSEQNVIETHLEGDIHYYDVLDFIKNMVNLTIETRCYSWIVDYTKARYKLSTLEIHDLPKASSEIISVLEERKTLVRRAIIRVMDKEDFSFLENTAVNRGENLRVFSNRKEAQEWLGKDR